ncbi:MAG TPA: P1 family peptidase [Pseudonocardiaceae bacterium]|jgi:L-aminopeptidase/D-esterase-like protein|nr:P1 family peptidase [Pseudonocardiaceae bacterium]
MTTLLPVRPGPANAITDVAGVLVGHHQRIGDGWATGTTVVLVPDGAVGAVDGRGGAPGTRETDLLEPSNLVQRAHGICLTGGSAYGLAAADGVMRWLGERNHGFPVGPAPHEVVPIVPAAVLFDLPLSSWGNRPDADFGYAACEAATAGPVAQGCVGAGTGARLGSFKGGIGTASAVFAGESGEVVVGALVAANAAGEAVDLNTGRPFAADFELAGEFGAVWPGRPGSGSPAEAAPLNTTIGVVAVNAELSKAECRRLAMAAQDGLARSVRPAHSMFDGDTVFALATGQLPLSTVTGTFAQPARAAQLDRCAGVVAEVFARAMVHALLVADPLAGLPAYRDTWPGVLG